MMQNDRLVYNEDRYDYNWFDDAATSKNKESSSLQ
jgi:hypothetical protein